MDSTHIPNSAIMQIKREFESKMELTTLRFFLEVADAGSFSRASARIGIGQPSLSRHMLRLEEELSTKLFYRHGRGVSLTDEGQRLRETAQSVFAMLEATQAHFLETRQNPGGVVTLGVPPSIGATLCYPIARAFRRRAPNARLRIREGFSGILSEWAELERIDVAIMYDASRNKNLNATPLLLEDLFLVQPASVANPDDVTMAELADLPLATPGPENGLRRVIDRAFDQADMKPGIVMEVDSIPALRQLAGGGMGAAILPFGAIHREVRMNRLNARRIAFPAMRALLVIATPSNKPVTAATKALLSVIEDEALAFVQSGVLRGEFRKTGC